MFPTYFRCKLNLLTILHCSLILLQLFYKCKFLENRFDLGKQNALQRTLTFLASRTMKLLSSKNVAATSSDV